MYISECAIGFQERAETSLQCDRQGKPFYVLTVATLNLSKPTEEAISCIALNCHLRDMVPFPVDGQILYRKCICVK